jgi:hypothetical protein
MDSPEHQHESPFVVHRSHSLIMSTPNSDIFNFRGALAAGMSQAAA